MNGKTFYDAIRPMFGNKLAQAQVSGIDGIMRAFDAVGDGRQSTLAYALATAFHETGRRMVPVREGFASSDTGARLAVNKLAKARGPNSAVAKYAQPQLPHGHVYYGRGHVQLTWLENYRRSSADAGVDLVANPDAMLDPVISARVLVRGLIDGRWNGRGFGVAHYLPGDPVQARRTVNVLDKAQEIAGYYRQFMAALTAAEWRAQVKQPQVTIGKPLAPKPVAAKPAPQTGVKPGFWAWLINLLTRGK